VSETDLLDPPPSRPLWLWTLADLALLLVGFFVLVQATDRQALARGLREGFGGKVPEMVAPADPIPLAASAVTFMPGSAAIRSADGLADFATTSLRDPRVTLRVAGSNDVRGDVDPATGSASILAGDRARAVVTYLISRGVAADRIMIAAAATGHRGALVTMSFTGDPADRNKP
jgi:outer membrane protein OmpA-like peptidoglycan-associated protein